MGLDMYAVRVEKKYNTPVITDYIGGEPEDFFYWRKNRFMHNLMEKIYRKKGGKQEFNCVFLELTSDDIDYIETAVLDGEIDGMDAPGYFFGYQDYDEFERERDMEFIRVARDSLENGYKVYYYSWW